MPYFMIVLISYINLLNLSWVKKCLFLRNMEPLTFTTDKENLDFTPGWNSYPTQVRIKVENSRSASLLMSDIKIFMSNPHIHLRFL